MEYKTVTYRDILRSVTLTEKQIEAVSDSLGITPKMLTDIIATAHVSHGEPLPKKGYGDCWMELIASLPNYFHDIKPMCIARRQFGLEKYGTVLQHDNGRDSLKDVTEELLDGAVYAYRSARLDISHRLLRIVQELATSKPEKDSPCRLH